MVDLGVKSKQFSSRACTINHHSIVPWKIMCYNDYNDDCTVSIFILYMKKQGKSNAFSKVTQIINGKLEIKFKMNLTPELMINESTNKITSSLQVPISLFEKKKQKQSDKIIFTFPSKSNTYIILVLVFKSVFVWFGGTSMTEQNVF